MRLLDQLQMAVPLKPQPVPLGVSMTSETRNQSVQSPQATEMSSTVRGEVILTYPAKSSNIAGKQPVKDNKAKDIDQLMGYLD